MMMKPSSVYFVLYSCLLGIVAVFSSKQDDFQASLTAAKLKLNLIIDDMKSKWEMHRMPNFLRSAAMTHSSWEILKVSGYVIISK